MRTYNLEVKNKAYNFYIHLQKLITTYNSYLLILTTYKFYIKLINSSLQVLYTPRVLLELLLLMTMITLLLGDDDAMMVIMMMIVVMTTMGLSGEIPATDSPAHRKTIFTALSRT